MALKPAILLGLLCAAFAANFSPSLLRGYRAGHQYAYNFDGQIASSLSNGEDYSTVRVRSDVTLDFLDNNNVIVKLERPEMASLNGFLSEPERLHSFQKFENLGIKSDHVNKLALPFEMRYENGKIGQIKFHQEDSTWSENIKRSIINLLQVQLEDISEEADEYPSSIFYKTNETTIEGECETAYHIQKIEDRNYDSVEETRPSVNITKTVNYDSCKRRPELRYNYYRASEPVEWNSQQGSQPNNDIDPIVDAMSHYDISLENSIIKNAKVLSKYSYDLVTKEQVSLATIAVGQIKYRSTEKRSPPESDFSKKSPQDLMHSTEYDVLKEKFIAEGNEEYLRKNPYLRLDNAGDVVKNIMRRLVKSSVEKTGPEGMDEDATRQFTNLVTILRLCSKDDISKIHRDTFLSSEFNDQTKQFVQEILADALAVAGTKNTIDHLVEKIQAQEITPSKAARTLEKLYKLRLTSVEMTKPVWKLCQSNVAQNNENLKRSCYLAWGAMVNAMCGHDHEHEHDHEKWAISMEKKICSQSVKKQFIQDAMSLYKDASNKADKILALKTIGNMGIDDSVSSLETVISDKAQDRLVRLNAIDALRNLRDQVPQKVQRLLTPVFRDRREHPEIRMNAFQQLLQTRPDAALLHMLCADMAHETNVDVKSFVVTSIQRLAENADKILDKESQQAIKSCLILLEQMDESITRQSASKKHQYGYFSEPTNWHEFGSLVNFVSLFSNDSYLPREVMASWDLLMGGRMIPNHMQLGLHMQELEQFTSKLYKNIESKNFDELLTRGKRSLMTQYNPLAMLKNLFHKMELVARRRASDAEPSFMLYRRLNNLDYSFFLIDETSLPEILKKLMLEGRVDVNDLEEDNQIIRTNGAMYNFESQMKLPTTMGVPMIISSRMSTIGFVDGKYTLAFNKAEKIRDVNVDIQLYPRLATSVIVNMEMFSPLFTSGVKTIHSMQGRLPLDMTVEIKSPNVVPTITWRLPQQETRLLHLQCRPITFIRSWPERSNVFVDAKEKTLLIPQLERLHSTNDFEFEAPLTGMRFVVEGHGYRKPWSNLDWILSGENAFVLKISPTASSVKAVRLGGEYSSTRDSVQTRQKLEKIFDEHPELFQQQEEQETKILQDYIRRSTSKLVEFQRLVLKAEAVDNRENFVSMDFKVACADQATACLFEKNVKADLGRTWTWKTIGQFAKPELHGIYGSVKSRHVVGKVETNWGAQEKNTVVMNFYGKPSQQRIHQFKSLLNKHIDMSDNYERENMLDEKFDQIPSVLKANEYVMSLEHQVSEKAMQTIVPLYNWMKACPKANIYIPDQSKVDSLMSQRHSTIMARVSYDNALNLTLTTPEEQVEMLHWDSEPQMSRNPKTIVDVFASSHDDYAKCTYKRQQIETFDGQTIDIPLTTCYTLLAKDCGDETNPNFAVLAKKMSKRSEDLKVKFITRKRIYELYKNERDGQMVITVDGNILREDQFEQYSVRKIESNTLTIYEVKCQHAEAIVRFDGQKLSIKISDSYLNRQCGVCGHMNRDREDDFLKHDNTQAKNAQDFHLSYLDRDASECDPSIINELQAEANKNSRGRQPAQSNYDDDRETRNPTKKTMIMEKRQEVCFSLKPVKVCPKGYEASETDQDEQVDFVCYKRSSTTAQQKLREARDEQVITFENETPDYTDMVTIPRRCVQY